MAGTSGAPGRPVESKVRQRREFARCQDGKPMATRRVYRRQLKRRCHKNRLGGAAVSRDAGSFMMRWAVVMQVSQMYTRGPATSFDTSAALLPQNEQASLRRKSMAYLRTCSATF